MLQVWWRHPESICHLVKEISTGSLKVDSVDDGRSKYAVTWVTCIIYLYILKTICITSSLSHKSSRCKNNFLLRRRSHFLFSPLTRAQDIRRIANSVDVIQGCGLTVLTTSKGYISWEWKWYIYTLYIVSFVSLSFIIPNIFLKCINISKTES